MAKASSKKPRTTFFDGIVFSPFSPEPAATAIVGTVALAPG
jgi:hypothetical protein